VSSLMATGHRDNQKQRLYDSEHVIKRNVSKAARRFLDEEARLIPQSGWHGGPVTRPGRKTTYAPSIEDCQRFVDHLVRQTWFQRRWGQRTYAVVWKASGSATCSGSSTIALPPWARTEGVILHEIAHGLPHGGAWHGAEFAGILLALVRHQMGAETAKKLRASMREERVRSSTAAVPKPTRPVQTASMRRERAAHRQQVDDQNHGSRSNRTVTMNVLRYLIGKRLDQPFGGTGSKTRRYALDVSRTIAPKSGPNPYVRSVSHAEVLHAAEGVRAAVRRGEFGAVGSKPRARAMAVARTLDLLAKGYQTHRLGGNRVYAAKPAKW
jgi:putative metallohydrolase (TIGR04338 family)